MLEKHVLLFLLLTITPFSFCCAQGIEIFEVEDFDLRGNVESCFVITDYGKEEYYFDETGRLTKAVTRYNDSDYETTYYKYVNQELIEKRVENYQDNRFDRATSLANFYTIDSTSNRKVTEKIISYEKELLEQNVYSYDEDGKLVLIKYTNTDGTDENTITYEDGDLGQVVTQKVNDVLLKTVLKSKLKSEKDSLLENVVTEKYFKGELNTKTEEIFNGANKLLSSKSYLYDSPTEKWISQGEYYNTYDEKGLLLSTKTKERFGFSTKEYIYQFDGTAANNWVKEIITPANAYKTRKITYYKVPSSEEKGELDGQN